MTFVDTWNENLMLVESQESKVRSERVPVDLPVPYTGTTITSRGLLECRVRIGVKKMTAQ